jgi:hypothetical protein
MPYRRNPFANRKYFHTEEPAAVIEQSKIQSYPDQPARLESIPMPNEADENTDVTPEMRKSGRLSIIDFFKNRIRLEEIIIFGLIFILLQEEVEDELLLILLIYILIG